MNTQSQRSMEDLLEELEAQNTTGNQQANVTRPPVRATTRSPAAPAASSLEAPNTSMIRTNINPLGNIGGKSQRSKKGMRKTKKAMRKTKKAMRKSKKHY